MESVELCYMPAVELAAAIREKRVSPVEVVDAFLARIERLNPAINAYCTVTAEAARAAAKAAEAAVMAGRSLGPLHGVPVSIKDLVVTKGVRTTWGSKIHEHVVPEDDAPVAARLKAAGAILLGKTNTPEYGWSPETDNRVFGPTRNPWDRARSAGGSGGGAGAAVAAGMGPLAVGTDGGGSIRIPGACCGIFGLKPSFGRVPVYPASAAESLSHTGPMTRTVRDAALMLRVMAGPDERDRNSLPADGTDYLAAAGEGIRGLRVAWSSDLGYALVDPAVREACERAARAFEDLGCRVEPAAPGFPDPEETWARLFWGAIGAKLAPYLPAWREQMDPGLVQVVEKGRALTAFQVAEAGFQRAALWDAVGRFFEVYDLLLTPTVAVPPLPLGGIGDIEIAGRTVERWKAFPFNFPFNLTGQPAATVPCGWTDAGLPIGLHIVGRRYADGTVLRAAAAFESARPWQSRRPPLD
jgi:Asp-tRNA(Asn)/Glu-tRNA(Gln) amidotransferase A subunit family amidase